MALENEMGTTMLVQPSGNGGFGNFGGDGMWILILFILLAGGGMWGGMGGFGNMALGYDFPWLLNGQNGINANTNSGFQNAMLNDGITSIRDGISGLSTQLCGGFAGVQQSLCNGFAGTTAAVTGAQNALAQQMYANQIADLERSFNAQTASTQGMNAIQGQLAQCCCDNRAATQDVKYTIATEACATRANSTANTQAILDKLCQLELDTYKNQVDAKNDTIAQLRSQLQFANMQASQVDQTAQLRTSQATTANQLVSELRSCPIPSQPVYGNQPIFTCGGTGCGCGAV